jgi:hypothetical protein
VVRGSGLPSSFDSLFHRGAIPIRLGLAPGLEDWTEYGKLSDMVGEGGHASIRRVVRAPAHLVRTPYEVLSKPTEFGRTKLANGRRSLGKALNFSVHCFIVAFLLGTLITLRVAGASEPKFLGELALQIAFAVPVLYVVNLITHQLVKFGGLAEAVCYSTGLFLPFDNVIGLAIASFSQNPGAKEIDIISTKLERCLS